MRSFDFPWHTWDPSRGTTIIIIIPSCFIKHDSLDLVAGDVSRSNCGKAEKKKTNAFSRVNMYECLLCWVYISRLGWATTRIPYLAWARANFGEHGLSVLM